MEANRYILATLIVASVFCYTNAERVGQFGNEIKASLSGVDSAGATFLIDDITLDTGVVFAYSAFFRSDMPVRFQVWRPVGNDSATHEHMLIGETRIIPAVKIAREDIYIASKLTERCIRVRRGDRLGVYIEEAPGAIAYTFDDNQPNALSNSVQNLTMPHQIGGTVSFGNLPFPYDFSLRAYIDTDLSRYNDTDGDFPDCPIDLHIPKYEQVTLKPTTNVPPPTGRPGAIGATGPQGDVGPQGPKGDIGPAGAMGPQGVAGTDGVNGSDGAVGANGERGHDGKDGVDGKNGAVGATGPVGPRGPPGEIVTVESTDPKTEEVNDGMFADPKFVMYLLIWLIVLTVIVVVFIVVCLVLHRSRRRHSQPKEVTRYVDRMPSQLYSNDEKPTWVDTMKEETETNYSNDTLSTRHDNSSPSFGYTNECVSDHNPDQTTMSNTELKNY